MNEIEKKLVEALDGNRIGRFGFNKSSGGGKFPIVLTIYDTENDGNPIYDEQLSFSPEELLSFCQEVINISTQMEKIDE